ncbi:MAG TPA: sensor histidine kinase [Actinomycetota bacterium]|nr:sensor histidine kinase [Actinomycetota bacterium]
MRVSLVAVRTGWTAAAAPLAALFAASIPALYLHKLSPPAGVQAGLDQLGISQGTYAAYWALLQAAFGVLTLSVGIAMVSRRPAEPLAWLMSAFVITVGTANAPNLEALTARWPGLAPAATVAFLVLLCSLVLLLFLFPDGRWTPRWTAPLAAALLVATLALRGSVAGPPSEALFFALVLTLVLGLGAQVYRYLRVSDPEQKIQTKRVSMAFGAGVGAQILFPMLEGIPALSRPGVGALAIDVASVTGITLGFSLVPLALAQAILKHRLWSLDVVINRTLVYGGLTVVLLGLYVAVAGGLGGTIAANRNLLSFAGAGLVALAFAQVRQRIQTGVNRLMFGRRDEPHEVMAELGRRLEASLEPQSVLPTIVETVAGALGLPYAAIELAGDAGPAAATGDPPPGCLRIPLVHRSERVGDLVVAPRSAGGRFAPAEMELLEDLARQASAAVAAVRLTLDLQNARERLVNSREEERRRMRRDLHDGLGPALAGMTLQADAAREVVSADPEGARKLLDELVDQLQASTSDIRRLVYQLRPPALDELGLAGALKSSLDKLGSGRLQLQLDLPDSLPPLPAAVEVAAFRIAHEAVANVVRHAGATSCRLRLRMQDGHLELQVEDDGAGMPEVAQPGIGLRSMRERASELGGDCAVSPGPEGGTVVTARLPLPAGSGEHP